MNVQYGRIQKLVYRDPMPKMAQSTSELRAYFRDPDGGISQYPIDNNRGWGVNNFALQFMALYDLRPTLFENGEYEFGDDEPNTVPVLKQDGEWIFTQAAFTGGETLLQNAWWFAPEGEEGSTDEASSAPNGGAGPDPGTGNRGGVDHEEETTVVELTPEEDTGVNIEV